MKKSVLLILTFWSYILCALAQTTVYQPVFVKEIDFEENITPPVVDISNPKAILTVNSFPAKKK